MSYNLDDWRKMVRQTGLKIFRGKKPEEMSIQDCKDFLQFMHITTGTLYVF